MAARASTKILAVWGLAAALAGAAAPALAATPTLVLDADSGRVLYADRATDPWYPASITKLMTTYVALDMARDGKVSMNTLLTMTANAAAQPPSKMGFRPGTQITLENALKIIMVKSANDVAAMIGDNLGGSVEGFASLMNDTARRLGMRESRWTNPSGLPDERQHTSARDMAVLARALLRDFPEHEWLFHIGALKMGRQIIANHNGLLGRYPGADGMKTGFICMGGFNIVASATRGGRRLIAVVMGYPSAKERDYRTADLLDQGFAAGGWGGTIDTLAPSSLMEPPNLRETVCGRRRPPEEDDNAVAAASIATTAGNPLASLFSPSAFGTDPATAGDTPIRGTRRDLGPRVAFAPLPVWIGADPGDGSDGTAAAGKSRLAAKPVRTKPLARAGIGQMPASAQAFAPTPASTPSIIDTVPTVPTRPDAKPGALRANLHPVPTAAVKPKPGALGSSGTAARPKLGAIEAKPAAAVAGAKPVAAKPVAARPMADKAVAAAKPVRPARPAPTARKPAASTAQDDRN